MGGGGTLGVPFRDLFVKNPIFFEEKWEKREFPNLNFYTRGLSDPGPWPGLAINMGFHSMSRCLSWCTKCTVCIVCILMYIILYMYVCNVCMYCMVLYVWLYGIVCMYVLYVFMYCMYVCVYVCIVYVCIVYCIVYCVLYCMYCMYVCVYMYVCMCMYVGLCIQEKVAWVRTVHSAKRICLFVSSFLQGCPKNVSPHY